MTQPISFVDDGERNGEEKWNMMVMLWQSLDKEMSQCLIENFDNGERSVVVPFCHLIETIAQWQRVSGRRHHQQTHFQMLRSVTSVHCRNQNDTLHVYESHSHEWQLACVCDYSQPSGIHCAIKRTTNEWTNMSPECGINHDTMWCIR